MSESENPYQTPRTTSPTPLENRGKPCVKCDSPNTSRNEVLRPRPGILSVILFGWLAILVRTALSSKTEACRDCGETQSYRTTTNHIALAILLIIVLLFATAYFGA